MPLRLSQHGLDSPDAGDLLVKDLASQQDQAFDAGDTILLTSSNMLLDDLTNFAKVTGTEA